MRSLEELLDADRLETTPGHPYGLDLSENEHAALVEFLKSLPVDAGDEDGPG